MNLLTIKKRCLILLIFFTLIFFNGISQSTCTPANASVTYECLYDSYAVGVFTTAGSTYSWYLNGVRKKGPVAGNGDAISFPFTIASASDAGQYTVEKSTPGFPSICVYNEVVVINETVDGLQTTAVTANSVNFTWTTTGKCNYYVSPDPYPSLNNPITTTSTTNSGTATGLSGGTTYYIHVQPDCGPYDWTTLEFTTLPGPCTVYTDQSVFYGGGIYCLGSSLTFGVTSTRTDQQYSLLRDGSVIMGPLTGNGASINFSFIFSSATQAGNYQLRVSKAGCISKDIGNETLTTITPVTGLSSDAITEVTAGFSWNATGGFDGYDYGVTTSSTPPSSTIYNTNANTIVVEDLNPSTNYYFHVKPRCSGPGSITWTTIAFTTLAVSPVNCSVIPVIPNCTPVYANIPAGGGPWNFAGSYPYNSVGIETPGKELLYIYTAPTTGVYYINVLATTPSNVSFLYKVNSPSSCSNIGWTGISNVSQTGKYPIGMLQAGVSYVFLLDAARTTGVQLAFQICKSTVAPPSAYNTCLNGNYLLTPPPYSSKEEFIIDTAGNLIASIDVSQSPNPQSLYFTYKVNNQTIRRDNNQKEYLDRSYSVSAYNAKIKLFFTNAELQRLINEPNDGNGDVGSLADVHASWQNQYCEDELSTAYIEFRGQIGNGSYDANSSYIVINGNLSGNVFLHGGNQPLNEQCASAPNFPGIELVEGFNSDNSNLIPACWWQTKFGSEVAFQSTATVPSIPLFEGSKYLFYNSAVFNASTSTILNVKPVNTVGYNNIDVEFYWYNNNNPAHTSPIEGVQVEYSTDNSSFNVVGFFQRHDASLSAGTGKWKKKRIALPASAGNKDALYVRFIFFSQHGDNCAMDAVAINMTQPCTEVSNVSVTSLTGSAATINWTGVVGVTSYAYSLRNLADNSIISGTVTTNSISRSDLTAGTDYFVTISPICSPGVFGEEYSFRFSTAANSCGSSNTFFSTPFVENHYAYQWQVDNGSGFVDISNNAVYSGATTNKLQITSPPPNYSGYKYRCWSIPFGNRLYLSTVKELKIGSTWTGLVSNNWNIPGNWSCGTVPSATTDIIIPAGVPNNPNISILTATCKSITIKPGAILNIANGFKLTITGN